MLRNTAYFGGRLALDSLRRITPNMFSNFKTGLGCCYVVGLYLQCDSARVRAAVVAEHARRHELKILLLYRQIFTAQNKVYERLPSCDWFSSFTFGSFNFG